MYMHNYIIDYSIVNPEAYYFNTMTRDWQNIDHRNIMVN